MAEIPIIPDDSMPSAPLTDDSIPSVPLTPTPTPDPLTPTPTPTPDPLTPPPDQQNVTAIIVTVVVVLVVSVVVVLVVNVVVLILIDVILIKKKVPNGENGHSMDILDLEELNCLEDGRGICTYTKKELAKATDNFTTEVGQGASGFVYRANLPGNRMGAVKRAMNLDPIGQELFKQELSVLIRLPRHPHLVDFIGLCFQEGERILVFEFISNGNLHDRLHRGVSSPLSWAARMDIAYQVAVALQYLHEEAKPPIFHRDVKSANVLLVDDHYAKLADFGLSRLGPKNNQFTITAVRGSHGYMDPQYMKTSRYSAKSDVYSFGVVLLELITGLKSLHDDTPLAEWTQPYRSEGIDRFKTIVDPNMIPHINMMELQNMFKIVNVCLAEISEERSSMREILNMMQETRNINSNEAPSLGNGNVSNEAPSLGNGNVSNEAPSLPNVCLAEISEERSSMGEILNMMKETRNINSNEAPSLGNGNV